MCVYIVIAYNLWRDVYMCIYIVLTCSLWRDIMYICICIVLTYNLWRDNIKYFQKSESFQNNKSN